MRGSMATCAFMMGDNDGGSLAEVTHDTAIDDGNQHTFTFSKGSQASDDAGGLGKNCISLNVDDGTAVSSCNTNCSWVETDTFYIGGLPSDFDRDGQSTDRTPAGSFFGGGGGWDDSWDPSWDDTAIISAGNFITADVRPNLPVCACFAMYWLSRWAWVAQGGSIRDLKYSIGCPPDTTDATCISPTTSAAPPPPTGGNDDASGSAQAGPAAAVMLLAASAMF